mmetsp:Transcript_4825/g.9205  ORF Transcript_4825/g.9205 Transcript_4825/m.9205 type:complete len:143 (+) Transcript_4825:860-1288(+)
MLALLTILSLDIVLEGNMYPANESDISQSPLINDGYTCADGGILNTEFLSTAGSRVDSFAAKPLAFAGHGWIVVAPTARGDETTIFAASRLDVILLQKLLLLTSAAEHDVCKKIIAITSRIEQHNFISKACEIQNVDLYSVD